MHPMDHARTSAKTWGGAPEDYLHIHQWFDETKAVFADFRHRALRHHAEGIFWAEALFGVSFTNSDGKLCHVRYVAEQHIKQDCGGRIPSAVDWLREIRVQPWMAHCYTAEGTVGTAPPAEEPADAEPAAPGDLLPAGPVLLSQETGVVLAEVTRLQQNADTHENRLLEWVQQQLIPMRAAMAKHGVEACRLIYEGSGDSGCSQLGCYLMTDGTKRRPDTNDAPLGWDREDDQGEGDATAVLPVPVDGFPVKQGIHDPDAGVWQEVVMYLALDLAAAAADTLETYLSAVGFSGYANNNGGGGTVTLTQEEVRCEHYWYVEETEHVSPRRLPALPPSHGPLGRVQGTAAEGDAARAALPRLRGVLDAHGLGGAYVRYEEHKGGWVAEVSYSRSLSRFHPTTRGDLRAGGTWEVPLVGGASMDSVLPEALLPFALQVFPLLAETQGGYCVVALYVEAARRGVVSVTTTAPIDIIDQMAGRRLPPILRSVDTRPVKESPEEIAAAGDEEEGEDEDEDEEEGEDEGWDGFSG